MLAVLPIILAFPSAKLIPFNKSLLIGFTVLNPSKALANFSTFVIDSNEISFIASKAPFFKAIEDKLEKSAVFNTPDNLANESITLAFLIVLTNLSKFSTSAVLSEDSPAKASCLIFKFFKDVKSTVLILFKESFKLLKESKTPPLFKEVPKLLTVTAKLPNSVIVSLILYPPIDSWILLIFSRPSIPNTIGFINPIEVLNNSTLWITSLTKAISLSVAWTIETSCLPIATEDSSIAAFKSLNSSITSLTLLCSTSRFATVFSTSSDTTSTVVVIFSLPNNCLTFSLNSGWILGITIAST